MPTTVEVLTAHGTVSALTYVAKTDRIDNSLRPYTWYKQFVLHGAREHGLPDAYIRGIEMAEASSDPDKERERRKLALLDGM